MLGRVSGNLVAQAAIDSGVIVAEIAIRRCRADDLPGLEWFGLYGHQREMFVDEFARHLCGDNIMLVAELNQFPVGQAWVDLTKRQVEGVGYIWAVRVFPLLRNLGIGTLVMRAAEEVLRQKQILRAEVGIEKSNADARRLCERLGYSIIHELTEESSSTTPDGEQDSRLVERWILRKELGEPAVTSP